MWYEGNMKVLTPVNFQIMPTVALKTQFNILGNTFIRRLAETFMRRLSPLSRLYDKIQPAGQ